MWSLEKLRTCARWLLVHGWTFKRERKSLALSFLSDAFYQTSPASQALKTALQVFNR